MSGTRLATAPRG